VERGREGTDPGGAAEEANPPDGQAPVASPDAAARADVRLPQWACDACFADGSWRADAATPDTPLPVAEPSGASPGSVGAAAVLAFALGGAWRVDQAETEQRRRRQWLS
jgi:hypothetical protein